jgi:hypothetical protein
MLSYETAANRPSAPGSVIAERSAASSVEEPRCSTVTVASGSLSGDVEVPAG